MVGAGRPVDVVERPRRHGPLRVGPGLGDRQPGGLMYPEPTPGFITALSYSHQVATTVQLFRTDGSMEVLPHTGGSVTVDRGQAARRTCTVTLADTSLIPRTPADKLSVYGAQLVISRGLYMAGQPVTVPIGRFRIDEVSGDPDVGPVTITGTSLEAIVSDAVFQAPTTALSIRMTAFEAI